MKSHGFLLLLLLLFLSPSAAQQPSDSSSSDGYNTFGDGNVSPSMALIVIVLVLAVFIIGTFSLCIQRCSYSSSGSGDRVVTAGRSWRGGNHRGLDQSVIDTFPTFIYSAVKELKLGKGSLECAVCLSEFQEDETLRLLPSCDHVFHSHCIDSWLVGHTTCPVCRANLDQLGNSNESTQPIGSDGQPGLSEEVQITIVEGQNRKFPRSHSTGHSLSRPGEDCERFTLRLPAEIRRQLVAKSKLKRSASLVALPRASSSRRGYRGGGDGSGSSRYGGRRWGLPFMSRVGSFRSTAKVGVDGGVTAGSSMGSKRLLGTVVTPSESLPPLPPVSSV